MGLVKRASCNVHDHIMKFRQDAALLILLLLPLLAPDAECQSSQNSLRDQVGQDLATMFRRIFKISPQSSRTTMNTEQRKGRRNQQQSRSHRMSALAANIIFIK